MQLSVNTFEHVIKKCWSRETSGDPAKRSDGNPSYRQCLITALLANEFLGFDVYTEKVVLASDYHGNHYFNKDEHDNIIRFCDEQFKYDQIINRYRTRKIISREGHKSHPEVEQRYEILKKRFQEELALSFS